MTTAATRRVRFKFDDHDRNQNIPGWNPNRPTRSFDDVRLAEKNCIHRVEFAIPIHKGTKSLQHRFDHISSFLIPPLQM